ncbi:MAG: S1 RNA-binding domain-containing protein, partial [Phycisphaerae bacterium]
MEPTPDSADHASNPIPEAADRPAPDVAADPGEAGVDQPPASAAEPGRDVSEAAAPVPAGSETPKTATEMLAAATADADPALDQALEEAMRGITEADLSAAATEPGGAAEPKVGDLVTGRIANIGSEDVLVDFGAKMLGVLPQAELDGGENYQVGDSIEILVTGEDRRGGLLTVSRKKAKQEAILRDMKVGMVLEGTVAGMNRGGLEVDVEGLRAFIPASQVDIHFVKDISNLIGTQVRAEVTKFDRDDRNLVLSRRKVLAREAAERKKAAFETLEVGQIKSGRVRNLAEFGAFVDIGGVDGLLHVTDMSWGRVRKPEDIVKLGDEIEVKIIKINKEKRKVSLSLKQTKPNPWETAAAKYPVGTQISGRVVRLEKFGAFVELEPGLDALLPVSEMSWTRRVHHPKEIVKEGDVIEASIIGSEPEKQRMSISLKALADDPWATVPDRYPAGSKVKGKVVRTTEFGAFVELEEGIDGLIHISELSENRVRAVTDVVKSGDAVEVTVLGVNPAEKRVSLSMKPPPKEPSPEEIAEAKARQAAAEKRRSKKRRGGITFGWDQGLSSLDPT